MITEHQGSEHISYSLSMKLLDDFDFVHNSKLNSAPSTYESYILLQINHRSQAVTFEFPITAEEIPIRRDLHNFQRNI